jgi:hypothetical protein
LIDLPWKDITVTAVLIGNVTAFMRGWVIPRPIYLRAIRREEATAKLLQASIKAFTRLERLLEAK